MKSQSPSSELTSSYPNGGDNRLRGRECRVSMTTSWLGRFLPQISIYNRILRKAEKGGGETHLGALRGACARRINRAHIKSRTQDGSPSKASRPLWGEVRRAGAVLFSLLPQRISSLYHETKALQNRDLLVPVEGRGKTPDVSLEPEPLQNACQLGRAKRPSGTDFCKPTCKTGPWGTWGCMLFQSP